VLSARGTTEDRITGLADGADDYLPKPFSPAELALRVHRVLARGATSPLHENTPTVVHGDLVLDRARHVVTVAGEQARLTAVEFRLLGALLDASGRVLTRDQLLDAVYGNDQDSVLDRTIDVHIGRLRDKLHDSAERPRHIETVRGLGYRAADVQDGAQPGPGRDTA
jgi:DNA-binding response OmpR family regulator